MSEYGDIEEAGDYTALEVDGLHVIVRGHVYVMISAHFPICEHHADIARGNDLSELNPLSVTLMQVHKGNKSKFVELIWICIVLIHLMIEDLIEFDQIIVLLLGDLHTLRKKLTQVKSHLGSISSVQDPVRCVHQVLTSLDRF